MVVVPANEGSEQSSTTLIKWIVVDCLQWADDMNSFSYKDSEQIQPVLGLCLGLTSVVVSQIFTLMYHWYRFAVNRLNHQGTAIGQDEKEFWSTIDPLPIQKGRSNAYEWKEGVITHVVQVEGFVLLGGYLAVAWIFGWMPNSYYKLGGSINWWHVGLQLLVQDGVQYLLHVFEHRASAEIYKYSHKPHHRFTNPRLFDAFNGSMPDTILMILVPLLVTKTLIHANVWSYMAFGSLYSSWLTLIHSEWAHPWDKVSCLQLFYSWLWPSLLTAYILNCPSLAQFFRKFGFGTAADHHVHHALFVYNFGHLFMYCDWIFGTYKDPATVSKFNQGV